MKKSVRERGSVEAVVIGILVVALVAALGWIFWQNLINKDEVAKQNASESTVKDETQNQKAERVPSHFTKSISTTSYERALTLKYPDSWKAFADVQTNNSEKLEMVQVVSPDSQVTITLTQTSDGQYGGACDSSADYTVDSVDSQDLYSANASIKYYQVVAKREGMYQLYAELMNSNGKMGQLTKGGSACGMLMENLIPVGGRDEKNTVTVAIDVRSLRHDDGTPREFNNRSTIDTVLASQDYKTAVQILRTATIK